MRAPAEDVTSRRGVEEWDHCTVLLEELAASISKGKKYEELLANYDAQKEERPRCDQSQGECRLSIGSSSHRTCTAASSLRGYTRGENEREFVALETDIQSEGENAAEEEGGALERERERVSWNADLERDARVDVARSIFS